jgi:tetratricopeptide (TPR) repeat protein
LLRHNLAELKLDWDGPETPAAPASDGKPLEVHVVLAQGKPASPVPGEADRLALESLYREGKYKEAIAAGIATVKAAPNVKSTYLTLSDAYYRVGEFDQAAAAARRHLDLCPDCPMAVTRLAKSQVAAGDHGAAVQTLERALQANSNRAALYDSLAWLYLTGPVGVRNAEKALPLAQKAVALAPTNTIYQLTLGAIYYRLGKFDQAVEILSAMKPGTAKSTSALTQLFLAMSYHRLGKADLAAASYRQAPPPSPDDRIDPQMVKEIESIRAEAAALLGVK